MNSDWKIPLYKIYSDDEDVKLVTKVIKRGNFWAIGPEIDEFEKELSKYVGSDYCVALNSGTSALHATLLSYGVKQNDEVIVPSFSFISTANSVLFVNAKPVFSDIEEEHLGLDPKILSSKISSKTKAIIPMDYGGLPCKIIELKEFADENNITLIEDSAESLGAKVNGKKIGNISNASIFSFCGNKVMTTGEGGAVTTNSKEVYEKLKLIRSHGRIEKISYFENPMDSEYSEIGYNWRISAITAALGLSQLAKLDKLIRMRQEVANFFTSRLSQYTQIQTPKIIQGYENIFQMYTIRLPNEMLRDKLHQFLLGKKIFCKIYFSPIHLRNYYKLKFGTKENDLPNTEKISKQVLTLPMYPNMTNEEKSYVIESIDEFFELNS